MDSGAGSIIEATLLVILKVNMGTGMHLITDTMKNIEKGVIIRANETNIITDTMKNIEKGIIIRANETNIITDIIRTRDASVAIRVTNATIIVQKYRSNSDKRRSLNMIHI
jgi:hypothetical protein